MKFNILACLFCCLIALPACSVRLDVDANKMPNWLMGEWKGIGYQINYPQTWTMDLNVGKDKAHIAYPTLSCSGEWVLESVTGDRVTFVENITIGKDKCVHGGKVVITLVEDGFVSYSYFNPESGKLEAHSTLQHLKSLNTIKS